MDPYDTYGRLAGTVTDPTVAAGRRAFQAEAETLIAADVATKLNLRPGHRLLEIGCGVGNLLAPLAGRVREAVGVDHPSCIARAQVPDIVTLVAGRWPAVDVGTFDSVLAYSVLHLLRDADEAEAFIDACVAALEPDGRALIGDIANPDAARRFADTEHGRRFISEYRARATSEATHEDRIRDALFARTEPVPWLSDAFLLDTMARHRRRGVEAYLLPQRHDLPFGWTREDLLLWRRP